MNLSRPETEQDLIDLLQAAFEAHQGGGLDEAETLYRHLLIYAPHLWQIHYNLGLLLYELNRLEEALDVYEEGLEICPDDQDLLFNYAICQKRAGLLEPALESYDKALALDPDNPEIHYNRAGCLGALQLHEEAFRGYEAALKIRPDYLSALINQAFTCHRLGDTEMAISRYRTVLELDPHNGSAEHMLASLTGRSRTTTPQSYIQDIFDEFSSHYDTRLTDDLEYSVPDELLGQVTTTAGSRYFDALLDLGCGTGLAGKLFTRVATTLHGVDLSAKMLELAQSKNIYSQLHHASIEDYLERCQSDTFDLVIAADVFNYLGELDKVFSQLYRVTTAGGFFFFSIEEAPDNVEDMKLLSSGRFAHSGSYIHKSAQRIGWQVVSSHKLNLRRERGAWVKGSIYGLQRSAQLAE